MADTNTIPQNGSTHNGHTSLMRRVDHSNCPRFARVFSSIRGQARGNTMFLHAAEELDALRSLHSNSARGSVRCGGRHA
jgi:hypothetical protein